MATTATAASNLDVEVSTDRMSVTLTFPANAKIKGPKQIEEEEVLDALERAEIELTDDVKLHVAAFTELVKVDETVKNFVVAEGHPPFEGKDEEFIWNEAYQKEADSWHEDSAINYYEDSSIITVGVGEVVGSIAPLEPPRDGIDVTGRTIPAKGQPTTLTIDPNAFEHSPEDPTQIITKMAGYPRTEGNTLFIEEVLTIAGDVNFETGRIDSKIGVHIEGRILDRFTVRSEGSITVGAAIEAAHVYANGDITVKRGILGRGTGLVMATGDIIAKFCTEAHLSTQGDIKIARQVMASNVCVGGKLIGTAAGLIGGCVYAGSGVEIATIGSDANVATRVVIGVAPDIVREIAVLHRSLKKIQELIQRIEELLTQLEPANATLTDEQKKCVLELREQTKTAKARIKDDQAKRDKLLEEVYTDGEHTVLVGNTIFAGTVIRVSDRETVFRKNLKGPVSIEKRKLNNITELVAVNKLTAGVTVLTNERFGVETLLEGFELESEPEAPTRR